MKILHRELKHGLLKVRADSQDDVWCLGTIIRPGDILSASTVRKIKLERSETESVSYQKKVFLKIRADKVEFHSYSDALRVLGEIIEGPEDIPRGTHHSFSIEPDTTITIEKEHWPRYELQRIEDATQRQESRVLIVLFDREQALFAELRGYGYEVLTQITGNIQKKSSPEKIKNSTYYHDLVSLIKEFDQKKDYTKIVIGSPAFWKEYLVDVLAKEPIKKKIITTACNSIELDGVNEVLHRPEVVNALKDDQVVQEMALVDELLTEIKKSGLACYGFKETKRAIESGAVEALLVTDAFLRKARQSNQGRHAENMLRNVEDMKGRVKIINTTHIAGKKLDGLGGIAALLRYKLSD